MMFKQFFKMFDQYINAPEITEPKPEVVPGTKLAYNSNLIKELTLEHKKILTLYTSIADLLDKGDYQSIQKQLKVFASALRSHLLKENLKLYVYLTCALARDTENLEIMTEMRREMGRIGRAVNQFLSRYTEPVSWTREIQQSFPGEFKQIGEVLADRIQREEETLYSLYMPPSSYLSITETETIECD